MESISNDLQKRGFLLEIVLRILHPFLGVPGGENFYSRPNWIRKMLWKLWHPYMTARTRDITCLNYGYVDSEVMSINLEKADERERYCLQLYHYVATAGDIVGKDVLEVGCGRGGGASYIARYLSPRSYVGVDISNPLIKFSKSAHSSDNLSFVTADAEKLPFDDCRFDYIINIESSRTYGNMRQFLVEAMRVLRPGGCLLFADFRKQENMSYLWKDIESSGLSLLEKQDITKNVVAALDSDSERRRRTIAERIPGFLKEASMQFAGVKGSDRYKEFENGNLGYWRCVLQKNGSAAIRRN